MAIAVANAHQVALNQALGLGVLLVHLDAHLRVVIAVRQVAMDQALGLVALLVVLLVLVIVVEVAAADVHHHAVLVVLQHVQELQNNLVALAPILV